MCDSSWDGRGAAPDHTPISEGHRGLSGGRPDLAGARLAQVAAPTLLIVGGADHLVLDLNRKAAAELRCEHDLAVVPGATHLFEEPGALALAASLTRGWLLDHLEVEPRRTPTERA